VPILQNTTMTTFQKGRETCRTVLLPCGSLEEHGPHLPLGTDTLHPVALGEALAERAPVWVAPPLFYGLCRSSGRHPGTVGIRGSTLHALVRDVVHGFYRQGMRQVIVLSGHAGGTHMSVLVDAGEQLLEELPRLKMAVLSVLDVGKEAWEDLLETPGDSHAGEMETSVMLHLHPQWVDGTAPEEYPSFPKHILVRRKEAFWKGGVWGNPGAASEEKGQAILERSVDFLARLVEELEKWEEP